MLTLPEIEKNYPENQMAKDIQPFLFDPADTKKVIFFPDYIGQVKLR